MSGVTPVHPEGGPPVGHLTVPVGKGLDKITGFLTDLQGLNQVSNLPPAVQDVLDLGTQLSTLLATKSADSLAEIHGIIPALHKALATLEPLVHQIKQELSKGSTIDFTTGPFSTAWTNALLGRAKEELTALLNLIPSSS